ncbi:phosphatase domain-containing protein [Caldilinea sp.]|uniref:App1 family protein n=1 Tax=Caldilinea sp. TaxID=2293560 RepID=UPI002C6BC90F|nr:DUF2183 domain-containing protein [Caldilinea sp.]
MSRSPLVIVPYRSFGTPTALLLRGRVLYERTPDVADISHSIWRNFRNALRRIDSHEAPGVTVEARYQNQQLQTVTDHEGYFDLHLPLTEPIAAEGGWQAVPLSLVEAGTDKRLAPTTAEVLVPPTSARYGIISDIDDTVLQTGATSFVRTTLAILLQNAATRLPFRGVAALYRALYAGYTGNERNPIFYVSSSPWNLYDFLVEFMQLRGIPAGPVFLRDYSITMITHKFSHNHKLESMRSVLEAYPDLPFVLMGDSGQQDPELYTRLAETHPGRVRAIYIRDVSGDRRDAAVDAMADALRAQGVPLLRVADSLAAAASAVELGLLPAAAVDSVRAAMTAEEDGG